MALSTTLAAMPRRPPNAALPQSSWSVPSRPTLARRHGSSAVVAMAPKLPRYNPAPSFKAYHLNPGPSPI
eukprot:scaffold25566_cov31-Phaeocystis_antarctica.AAC.1